MHAGGGAVQVDPRLTPGSPRVDRAWRQRLKLQYDKLLSNFAFNFNFRRYREVLANDPSHIRDFLRLASWYEAGASTRPLFGST